MRRQSKRAQKEHSQSTKEPEKKNEYRQLKVPSSNTVVHHVINRKYFKVENRESTPHPSGGKNMQISRESGAFAKAPVKLWRVAPGFANVDSPDL
jgi:hypothetical protein